MCHPGEERLLEGQQVHHDDPVPQPEPKAINAQQRASQLVQRCRELDAQISQLQSNREEASKELIEVREQLLAECEEFQHVANKIQPNQTNGANAPY